VSLVTGSTSGSDWASPKPWPPPARRWFLNGFGKPEDADAQEKIASEFKVRVSYSPADMSKPVATIDMIQRILRSSGRLPRHPRIPRAKSAHRSFH
jgi:3-hydroxybutyrate dehydrogenase